ncbi:hypothetical protein HPB50_028226 [Hyalomma asiaticum]|nr:hypothetical protein HPB50_028226 [Hyalomma asiaticum]
MVHTARTSAVVDNAGGDGGAIVPGHVGFERSCTWEPDQKQCWIVSDLDLWNRVLARNCVELRQHTWGRAHSSGLPVARRQSEIGGLASYLTSYACAASTTQNLSFLLLSGMWFDSDMVQILGTYVEHATALSVLELKDIEVSLETCLLTTSTIAIEKALRVRVALC